MMIGSYSAPDPYGGNVFLQAAQWVQSLVLGPLATSIAIIAVGAIGLLMLSGRINLRRGATVIVGCFVLFGAATIALGLRGIASTVDSGTPRPGQITAPATLGLEAASTPPSPTPGSADPYAGAAIRR